MKNSPLIESILDSRHLSWNIVNKGLNTLFMKGTIKRVKISVDMSLDTLRMTLDSKGYTRVNNFTYCNISDKGDILFNFELDGGGFCDIHAYHCGDVAGEISELTRIC